MPSTLGSSTSHSGSRSSRALHDSNSQSRNEVSSSQNSNSNSKKSAEGDMQSLFSDFSLTSNSSDPTTTISSDSINLDSIEYEERGELDTDSAKAKFLKEGNSYWLPHPTKVYILCKLLSLNIKERSCHFQKLDDQDIEEDIEEGNSDSSGEFVMKFDDLTIDPKYEYINNDVNEVGMQKVVEPCYNATSQILDSNKFVDNVAESIVNDTISSSATASATTSSKIKKSTNKIGNGEILYQLRKRFVQGRNIYTYIGDVLVSINPYASLPTLYSRELRNMYHYNDIDKSFGRPAPHVWAIASEAYKKILHYIKSKYSKANLPICTKLALFGNKNSHLNMKPNQRIWITGDSSSGKTENVKLILNYLLTNERNGDLIISETSTLKDNNSFRSRIFEALKILDAFGGVQQPLKTLTSPQESSKQNEDTVPVKTSTKHSRFIDVSYDKIGDINGCYIGTYLFDKNILTGLNGNYAILYSLKKFCSSTKKLSHLNINPKENFHYLNEKGSDFPLSSNECEISGTENIVPLIEFQKAFKQLDFKDDQIEAVFRLLSAILFLGNLKFEQRQSFSRSAVPSRSNKEKESNHTLRRENRNSGPNSAIMGKKNMKQRYSILNSGIAYLPSIEDEKREEKNAESNNNDSNVAENSHNEIQSNELVTKTVIKNRQTLQQAAIALGTRVDLLEKSLTTTEYVHHWGTPEGNLTGSRSSISSTEYQSSIERCEKLRDDLCKDMYKKLWNHIIKKINASLSQISIDATFTTQHKLSIFEGPSFDLLPTSNILDNAFSLESLYSNYLSDRFHHHICDELFLNSMLSYVEDSIHLKMSSSIYIKTYRRGMAVLDSKPCGMFNFIEEISSEYIKQPKGTESAPEKKLDKNILVKMEVLMGDNTDFIRDTFRDNEFTIRHYQGDANYSIDGFVTKNSMSSPSSIMRVVQGSTNMFISELYRMDKFNQPTTSTVLPNVEESLLDTNRKGINSSTSKLFMSINSNSPSLNREDINFHNHGSIMNQDGYTYLKEMVDETTYLFNRLQDENYENNFIRCLNSNRNMAPLTFDSTYVHKQLSLSNLYSYAKAYLICKYAYSFTHFDFLYKYDLLFRRKLDTKSIEMLKPEDLKKRCFLFCSNLATGLSNMINFHHIKIGKSRIYLKTPREKLMLDVLKQQALLGFVKKIQAAARGMKGRALAKERLKEHLKEEKDYEIKREEKERIDMHFEDLESNKLVQIQRQEEEAKLARQREIIHAKEEAIKREKLRQLQATNIQRAYRGMVGRKVFNCEKEMKQVMDGVKDGDSYLVRELYSSLISGPLKSGRLRSNGHFLPKSVRNVYITNKRIVKEFLKEANIRADLGEAIINENTVRLEWAIKSAEIWGNTFRWSEEVETAKVLLNRLYQITEVTDAVRCLLQDILRKKLHSRESSADSSDSNALNYFRENDVDNENDEEERRFTLSPEKKGQLIAATDALNSLIQRGIQLMPQGNTVLKEAVSYMELVLHPFLQVRSQLRAAIECVHVNWMVHMMNEREKIIKENGVCFAEEEEEAARQIIRMIRAESDLIDMESFQSVEGMKNLNNQPRLPQNIMEILDRHHQEGEISSTQMDYELQFALNSDQISAEGAKRAYQWMNQFATWRVSNFNSKRVDEPTNKRNNENNKKSASISISRQIPVELTSGYWICKANDELEEKSYLLRCNSILNSKNKLDEATGVAVGVHSNYSNKINQSKNTDNDLEDDSDDEINDADEDNSKKALDRKVSGAGELLSNSKKTKESLRNQNCLENIPLLERLGIEGSPIHTKHIDALVQQNKDGYKKETLFTEDPVFSLILTGKYPEYVQHDKNAEVTTKLFGRHQEAMAELKELEAATDKIFESAFDNLKFDPEKVSRPFIPPSKVNQYNVTDIGFEKMKQIHNHPLVVRAKEKIQKEEIDLKKLPPEVYREAGFKNKEEGINIARNYRHTFGIYVGKVEDLTRIRKLFESSQLRKHPSTINHGLRVLDSPVREENKKKVKI